MNISVKTFQSPEGEARAFILSNDNGASVTLSEWGAAILSVKVPDRNGINSEVTLGFDTWEEYTEKREFLGASIGRVANRIGDSRFSLNGKEYQLPVNDGKNHLHGGKKGLDFRRWEGEVSSMDGLAVVEFSCQSPDGEEGYPGNVDFKAVYTFTEECEFEILYKATTDTETPVCMTNHAYWNLAGGKNLNVFDHKLRLKADRMLPLSDDLIATKAPVSVEGTPWDFRNEKTIGADIKKLKGGFDHFFIFEEDKKTEEPTAVVSDTESGRVMELWSDQEGLQFYSGGMINYSGRGGEAYKAFAGFCLEPHGYPNAINVPEFPSVVLKPGQTYKNWCKLKFSVK